jgi:hypothetical protein
MLDKPLHVQVSEALGWRMRGVSDSSDRGCGGTDFWVEPGHAIDGARSHCNVCDPENAPPRYDTDWSATGPLIEKWRFHGDVRLDPTCHAPDWCAFYISEDGGDLIESAKHPTLLIAVCNLILALKEAGKLA